jgi:hypothetical protein
LESIILAGENLSNIDNAIEREAVLGLYPYDNKKIETRNKKRLEVHNMLLLDPGEITWDEDRRLLACLIYLKINLADFRKRLLYLFGWEDVPGEGNTKLREFLKEDYRSQEHFAYLIYDTEDEIDEAKITTAMQNYANSIGVLRRLFEMFPNKNRMEDLIAALEYRIKVAEGIAGQIWIPIEPWKNEVSELKEKKKRIEDFINRSMIKLRNFDIGELMTKSLRIVNGEGSLNGKKSRYICYSSGTIRLQQLGRSE